MAMFPGWYSYPGLYLDGPGIGFGAGFGVGLFAGFGWGWHHWDYDWHHRGRVEHDHREYISHSTTIVDRNHFQNGQTHFDHGGNAHGTFAGHQTSRALTVPHGTTGIHSGAFGGFTHGGIARGNALRGQSSFAGLHAGGGFHGGGGGGFHGGGGGHGGGGHR